MKVYINDDICDEVTEETLKISYDDHIESLTELLESGNECTDGLFSFNLEIEIYEHIDLLKSLANVIRMFDAGFKDKTVDIIQKHDLKLFEAVTDWYSLKEKEMNLIADLEDIKYEYKKLKEKITHLFEENK